MVFHCSSFAALTKLHAAKRLVQEFTIPRAAGWYIHSSQPTQRKPVCSAQEISMDVWSRTARKMSSCRRNGDWNGTASTSCSFSTCPPTQSLPLETGCGVPCFSGALQELRHCNAGIAVWLHQLTIILMQARAQQQHEIHQQTQVNLELEIPCQTPQHQMMTTRSLHPSPANRLQPSSFSNL